MNTPSFLYNAISELVNTPCSNEDISFEIILQQLNEYNLVSSENEHIQPFLESMTKFDKGIQSHVPPIQSSAQAFPTEDLSFCELADKSNLMNSNLSSLDPQKSVSGRSLSLPSLRINENKCHSLPLTQPLSGYQAAFEMNHIESPLRNYPNKKELFPLGQHKKEDTFSKTGLTFHTPALNNNILFNTTKTGDLLLRVRGSRVAASRDNWVVDPETAAFINMNSRGALKMSSCENDKNFEESLQMSGLEKPNNDEVVMLNEPNWFNQRVKEATDFFISQHHDAQEVMSSTPDKFGIVSHPSRRRKTLQAKKELLIREMLTERSCLQGYSIHWFSPVDLALTTCLDADLVETTRMIAFTLTLRDIFLYNYGEILSPCIFPAKSPEYLGQGSTEPIFDVSRVPFLPACDAVHRMKNGVFYVYWQKDSSETLPLRPLTKYGDDVDLFYQGKPLLSWRRPIPSMRVFLASLKYLMNAAQHPGCKTFAFRRLMYLRNSYNMHHIFNGAAELQEVKENIHRDFYNVRKVDTHVHHSACMHQKHLLRFIRKKYRTESNQVVARAFDGTTVTLGDIFDAEVGVTAWEASVDLLNVHALGSCFHRFDKFNSKYNPFGQPLLREVFLKTDNLIQGRYLAEITKEVVADLEDGKYQFVEWRISIYGKSYDEWKKLACWISSNGLSSKQVRWMIQVPRLFHVYQKLNLVKSFADFLHNIFDPLFQAVRDPEKHPEIYRFMLQMNGWDSVDDESIVSKYTSDVTSLPPPEKWTESANPPYSYWAYYMYANIQSLNQFLVARGLRPFPFRPHCGEAGSISHLASMFLLADEINHGIMLRKCPLLQYLYYLRQIGLAVSPLSNNALFHPITKNPFYDYFTTGMNVSLSSDDPLMFHFTDEALLEEYSCCAHVWRLSPVDLCEIARNSVLQSYFEPQLKKHWLGENYEKKGRQGNDISRTNVSNIRLMFRHEMLMKEWRYLRDVLQIDRFLDLILSKMNY